MVFFTLLLATLVLILTFSFWWSQSKRNKRFRSLIEELRGPPSYPIIGNVIELLLTPREKMFETGWKHFGLYGDTHRFWVGSSTMVFTREPQVIEALLSSMKHIKKGVTYQFLEPWLGTGLLTATGSKWHSSRKMITPTFHFSILEGFTQSFAANSSIMVKKLQAEIGKSGFDVYPYITRCTLDIICETAMGISIRAQDHANPDYVSAIYNMGELTIKRRIRPWLYLDSVYALSCDGRKYYKSLKILHDFSNKVITERKETRLASKRRKNEELEDIGSKRKTAFLDMLLDVSEDGANFTDEQIREEVDTFMFEGHDTTTAALCWALFLLGSHQDIQDKAYQELQSIFQGSDRPATMWDLQEMKYLERVIKETLRLYPSVPMVERKLTEDLVIGDRIIPAGVDLTVCIAYLHRLPDQFPDPAKFDPDNFLPERTAKRHPYAYLPFSAGPRNCIGQKFALLEEKMLLSAMLRHFKVQALDSVDTLNIYAELILRPANGIRLRITPRVTQPSFRYVSALR